MRNVSAGTSQTRTKRRGERDDVTDHVQNVAPAECLDQSDRAKVRGLGSSATSAHAARLSRSCQLHMAKLGGIARRAIAPIL